MCDVTRVPTGAWIEPVVLFQEGKSPQGRC